MRLLLVALAAGLSLASSAKSELLPKIPFRYQDGLIWLKVALTGKKETLNFLLDSGASVSAIDLQTARNLTLHLGEQRIVEGVNGRDFAYCVNDFQATAGGVPLPKPALAIDLGNVSACCHQHIDGILGIDFFRNRILQIDFDVGEISLLQNYSLNLAKCDILPMKICNDAFCVPLRVAGNSQQWMRLDTGCDSGLEWVVGGTERRRMGGPSIGSSGASPHFIKTSVCLGKHCFDNVTVGIHSERIFPGEDGLLGNGLLSKFSVIIDERRSRVIFERAQ